MKFGCQGGQWSVSSAERRLLMRAGAEHRVTTLETAEQGDGVAAKKSPQEELKSQTEQVAKRLEEKCIGWFNGLAVASGITSRLEIRKAAHERLAQASEKWNGWLYGIMHMGERRLLLAEARSRVVQDLLTYMEGKKSEILLRKQRFGRAAHFLRQWNGKSISASELKRKQNLSIMLGGMRGGYEKRAQRLGKGLEHLRGVNETSEMLRVELLEAGLPAEQLLPLFEGGSSRLSELKREIKKLPMEKHKKRSLIRAVRKLKWYGGRYQLLSALEQDPNLLPETQKLRAMDRDGMRGRTVDIDINGKKIKASIVTRSSPMLTLRDASKGRGALDAFMVLDTNEGKLLTRENTHLVEHDVFHDKRNRVHIPFSSAAGLASTATLAA